MGKLFAKSKTIWGASITLAAALIPAGHALATGDVPDIAALAEALIGFIGAAIAVYGRYVAEGTLYTPSWLPGRNAEDIDLIGKLMRGQADAESTWGPSRDKEPSP